MDPQDLMLTALRASLLYFFLLFVIRLLGKRSVGATGAFDLIVALMLGEVTAEVIFGNVSMTKGLLAISVIAVWHLVNSWASHKNKTIDKLTSGDPTILVKNGKILHDALAKERLNEAEVYSELRLMSVDDIEEVKKATLEPNGQISVIKEDWAEAVQKIDLPGKGKREKQGHTWKNT